MAAGRPRLTDSQLGCIDGFPASPVGFARSLSLPPLLNIHLPRLETALVPSLGLYPLNLALCTERTRWRYPPKPVVSEKNWTRLILRRLDQACTFLVSFMALETECQAVPLGDSVFALPHRRTVQCFVFVSWSSRQSARPAPRCQRDDEDIDVIVFFFRGSFGDRMRVSLLLLLLLLCDHRPPTSYRIATPRRPINSQLQIDKMRQIALVESRFTINAMSAMSHLGPELQR